MAERAPSGKSEIVASGVSEEAAIAKAEPSDGEVQARTPEPQTPEEDHDEALEFVEAEVAEPTDGEAIEAQADAKTSARAEDTDEPKASSKDQETESGAEQSESPEAEAPEAQIASTMVSTEQKTTEMRAAHVRAHSVIEKPPVVQEAAPEPSVSDEAPKVSEAAPVAESPEPAAQEAASDDAPSDGVVRVASWDDDTAESRFKGDLNEPQNTATKEERAQTQAEGGSDPQAGEGTSESGTSESGTSESGTSESGTSGDPAVAVLAAAWNQPELPQGESPWSEVVSTRGTHKRDHAKFSGFAGEVPIPQSNPLAALKEDRTTSTSAIPYEPEENEEIDEELAQALTGVNTSKIVAGALALLVVFGLLALLSRAGTKNEPQQGLLVARASSEVVLSSEPPGATVIAASDGSTVGKTPLTMLMPSDQSVSVFLAMDGHQPQRLSLPDRGRLSVQLTKRSDVECQLELDSQGAPLEGVGLAVDRSGRATVPGVGIVKAKADSDYRGAKLVTCPELGGAKAPKLTFDRRKRNPTTVRLVQPVGAIAYLNGDSIGRVPTNAPAHSAFSRILVEDAQGMNEERWVATHRAIEIHMPTPKPRKRPTVVVPDRYPEEKAPLPSSAAPLKPAPTAKALTSVKNTKVEAQSKPAGRARAKRLYNAGMKHYLNGRNRPALRRFRDCVKADPKFADCHRVLGQMYKLRRNPRRWRRHYRAYLKLKPSGPQSDMIRAELSKN